MAKMRGTPFCLMSPGLRACTLPGSGNLMSDVIWGRDGDILFLMCTSHSELYPGKSSPWREDEGPCPFFIYFLRTLQSTLFFTDVVRDHCWEQNRDWTGDWTGLELCHSVGWKCDTLAEKKVAMSGAHLGRKEGFSGVNIWEQVLARLGAGVGE